MAVEDPLDRIERKLDDLTEAVTRLRIHVASNLVTREEFNALKRETKSNRRWAHATAIAAVSAAATTLTLF